MRLFAALPLALLSAFALPVAHAQTCAGDNATAQYIQDEASGMAMHWASGLVWQVCLVGQSGVACADGNATPNLWYDWMMDYMPRSFDGQGVRNIPPGLNVDRLADGQWRLPYRNELLGLTSNCPDNPKINRDVFPAMSYYLWSSSPQDNGLSSAWVVGFISGEAMAFHHSGNYRARLVRGGQPFASLALPASETASAGDQHEFASITLASSSGGGQSWGGARIAGDGSPQFKVGNGDWVTEAIVKSGDTLTVRLAAGAAGSTRSATLTLVSGLTTGTATDATNGGDESTAPQQTTATFSVSVPVPVVGACGTGHGVATLVAPSANLCSAGTASSVSTTAAAYTWNCAGLHGGADSGMCSASRQYAVSPAVSGNGTITPATVQAVTYGQSASFTVTPASGHQIASVSGCDGSLDTNNIWTTAAVQAACTVSASFTSITTQTALPLPGGGTADVQVSGANCLIDNFSFIPAPADQPPGAQDFPYGLADFRLIGCDTGGSAQVQITYPGSVEGMQLWKRLPGDTWQPIPGATTAGNVLSFSIADGSAFDLDPTPGIIRDPSGPALMAAVTAIPSLSQWATALLAALLGLGTLGWLRHRPA